MWLVWDWVERLEEEICWEFDLVRGCVAVVRGGVKGVGPARAAAGPGYFEDIFKGWLVKLVIDQGAVNALVRDPLC